MTSARNEGDRVIITHRRHVNPEHYIQPLLHLEAAKEARDTRIGRVTRAELQPYQDALDAATAAVDALFQDELWLDEAERLYGHLGGSIVAAKVQRGDFNRGDDE